jgi:hypothetical protein
MRASDRAGRRRAGVLAGAALFAAALVACNALTGLSDYERVQCTGLVCDGGADPDVFAPDGSPDGGVDARVDAEGTLPVSWAAWPMPNYDAGPETSTPVSYQPTAGGVFDGVTRLAWQDPIPPGSVNVTLADARRICSGEWRLPSRIELVTLLDLSQGGAKIHPTFAGAPGARHWTFSEVRPVDPANRRYWSVDFGNGGLAQLGQNETAAVRCVRRLPADGGT